MIHGRKLVVVMPAYNAEQTLRQTYDELPHEYVDDVILVDDTSSDYTVKVAEELGIHTIVHKTNRGYGGNQKTCYREALKLGADVVVMVHPDYQYSPRLVSAMATMIPPDIMMPLWPRVFLVEMRLGPGCHCINTSLIGV